MVDVDSISLRKALGALSLPGRIVDGRLDIGFEDLQKAYRRKALMTHPDMSEILGREKSHLEEEFRTIHSSYMLLKDYLEKGAQGAQKTSYYPGKAPERKLRFGEFLYYYRYIDWDTLIRAIVWQARSRPKIGEIAVRLGYLTRENVNGILKKSAFREKFGETGLRLGLINNTRLNILIVFQGIAGKKIGGYFVENGIFTARWINQKLSEQIMHNIQCKV